MLVKRLGEVKIHRHQRLIIFIFYAVLVIVGLMIYGNLFGKTKDYIMALEEIPRTMYQVMGLAYLLIGVVYALWVYYIIYGKVRKPFSWFVNNLDMVGLAMGIALTYLVMIDPWGYVVIFTYMIVMVTIPTILFIIKETGI